MTKVEKIANFDPNGVGLTNANIFGLPFNYQESEIIILPVPWDVTVSYLAGTAFGAQAVYDYSSQIDLFDLDFKDAWQKGFFMQKIDRATLSQSIYLREKSIEYIGFLEAGGKVEEDAQMELIQQEINIACHELKDNLKQQSLKILNDGKVPVILGGDHSTPLGLMQALDEKYNDWGILQIDAHADLRPAYEGFEFSHASIMYNAVNSCKNLSKLVSVGVRDFCEQEYNFAEENDIIFPLYWNEIVKNKFEFNKTQIDWSKQCDLIIEKLPQNIYISFDIDGLQPNLCPNTGTPVAGGLSMDEAFYLLKKIVESGRKIIGADLCEVSVGDFPIEDESKEFNANVGSRVLYKLCGAISCCAK